MPFKAVWKDDMPIRFRRTFRILPGVRLNVSKHGISTSVGGRGAHLTFNRFGVRQSVGLPGTGLSETSYLFGGNRAEEEAEAWHRNIHHGEGVGCHLPGCGCLFMLALIAVAAIYFSAGVLHLHFASLLTSTIAQFWHSLSVWAKHVSQ